jgi:hypothetical protein
VTDNCETTAPLAQTEFGHVRISGIGEVCPTPENRELGAERDDAAKLDVYRKRVVPHGAGGCVMVNRERKIAERRAQMPRSCRGIYDKAMTGKSRKAAMHAFCAECVGWVIHEVYCCTDAGCPLYPYRPTSRASQDAPEDSATPLESPNTGGAE